MRLFLFPIIVFAAMAFFQMRMDKERAKLPMERAVRSPKESLPEIEVPGPGFRALKTDLLPYDDLPNASCMNTSSCPSTILVTGNSPYIGQNLAGKLLTNLSMLDPYDVNLANYMLGSDGNAFSRCLVLSQCTRNSSAYEALATKLKQGCVVDAGLREARKVKNHNENAWAGRWSLLDDFLCLFSFLLFGLRAVFCSVWFTYRVGPLHEEQ